MRTFLLDSGEVIRLVTKAEVTEVARGTSIPKRLTVGSSSTFAQFATIGAAIAAAVAAGASPTNYFEIVVYPGTYTEAKFTVQDGIIVTSDMSSMVQSVVVIAVNPDDDLVICNGGAITGIAFSGVSNSGKCIFRCSTPATSTYFNGCSVFACSNGWIVSDGSMAVIDKFSLVIAGMDLSVDTVISVTGAGTVAQINSAFLLVPSAILPAYAGNPIQTFLKVSDLAYAVLAGNSLAMADNDGSSSVVFAEGGAGVTLLASSIANSNYALHIGASGANTKIVNGATLSNNVRNVKIDSSTGMVYANCAADRRNVEITDGGQEIGLIAYQNSGMFIMGSATFKYLPSGKEMDLPLWAYDHTSTGLSTGGAVTAGTGLSVNVALGRGWVRRSSAYNDIYSTSWIAGAVTLEASATNYVYFDSVAGVLVANVSPPSATGVLLATVVTSGAGVRFLHQTRIFGADVDAALQNYLLTVAPQSSKSGLTTVQGSTARKLNIGSGSYYLGLDVVNYAGSGGDATWSYFYGTNGATEVAGVTDLNITQYDNAGTLAAMTAGYYRCDYLVLTSDGRLSVVYGTSQYATLALAQAGTPGNVPTFLQPSLMPLAKIYVKQNVGIDTILDAKPSRGVGSGASSAVAVHSALAGLSADDHTQYLLASGARAMAGDLPMGGHNITGVGTVDGITASAHGLRHAPGGADAVPTGTTSGTLATGDDARIVGALQKSGGALTGNLDGGGFAITNFDNGHTTTDTALTADASTALTASTWSGYQAGDAGVILRGLTASHKYLVTLGARVYIYTDADHAVGGAVDIVIGMAITTDGSGVATCVLSGVVIPDTSGLAAGIAGATATVAPTASPGGFIVSATRKASTACHARGKWWVNKFEDVTA